MPALYLITGLVCGAALTFVILYLLIRAKKVPAETSANDDLAGHAEAVDTPCLASLGSEKEFTDAENAEFAEEDAAAEAELCGCGCCGACDWAYEEEKAAEADEVITAGEVAAALAEAEKERDAFVDAKKCGAAIVVPELRFTLSREDVLDYIEDMAKALQEQEENPVLPAALLRKKKHFCDSLRCGEWCFALMYERFNVIKLTLRLDAETAGKIAAEHTAFRIALFPKGEFWYDLIVDSSFVSKREVYDIIDAAYAFVLGRYYRKENDVYKTDIAAARADASEIESVVAENADTPDPAFDTAVEEYAEALKTFRQKHKLPFRMTRKRLLDYAKRSLCDEGGEVIVRPKRCLPASLNSNGKTYALVYDKLCSGQTAPDESVKSYVSLTVRISDVYAAWLALRHPEVCRARFPKNRNWYVVPVDGSFRSAQMVYRVLKRAKKFVEN